MLTSSIGQDILNTPNFKAFNKLAISGAGTIKGKSNEGGPMNQ